MISLLLASVAWSLSFGLIADQLAGYDPSSLAAIRLLLATGAFMPWLRRLPGGARMRYALLGALQFGLMYQLYLASFASLPGHIVALLTVTTPIYVVLMQGAAARRLRIRDASAAVVAVIGALWIKWMALTGDEAWLDMLMLQGANLCFAGGQVIYGRWRAVGGRDVRLAGGDTGALAWMYVGAASTAVVGALLRGDIDVAAYPISAWAALFYLGVVPTGVAFWLWNRGVARVPEGFSAVMNNLKVPLAVVLSALLFGEAVLWDRLLPGGLLILGAAAWVSRSRR